MKHHWNYLKYVIRHKYYVFIAGRALGAPLWNLVVHDLSKFSFAEWSPYVNSFYRHPDRPQWVRDAFNEAWLHHIHHNAHHWQHWILQQDSGGRVYLKMPVPLVKEMVADWCGAGKAITGKWDVDHWYHENWNQIQLHDLTRLHVGALVKQATRDLV